MAEYQCMCAEGMPERCPCREFDVSEHTTPEHEPLWRVCDVCGRESLCPVWLATRCGGFIAKPDRMVACHGHFVEIFPR